MFHGLCHPPHGALGTGLVGHPSGGEFNSCGAPSYLLAMATLDDAAAACLSLPGVTEGRTLEERHSGQGHGLRTWLVGNRSFALERPFSNADIKRFGTDRPPDGSILLPRVADLRDKKALLQAHPGRVFTIPHFAPSYRAVLVHLRKTPKGLLRELIVDAWLSTAPRAAADAFLATEHRNRRARSQLDKR